MKHRETTTRIPLLRDASRCIYIYIYVNYIHICAYEIILSSWGLFVAQVVLLVVLSVVCWSCHVDAQPPPVHRGALQQNNTLAPPWNNFSPGGLSLNMVLAYFRPFLLYFLRYHPKNSGGPCGNDWEKGNIWFPLVFPLVFDNSSQFLG